MATPSQVLANFLTDLDVVCQKENDSKLPFTFIQDLESAYAHGRTFLLQKPAISVADLTSLAEDLTTWRSYHRQLLQQYLPMLPSDDPLLSPVSLFGTMDYGRLETAHTRVLAWLLNNREHGFGFQLLESLLFHILKDKPIHLTVDKVESEYPIPWGPALTDGGRIDVFAAGRWEKSGNEVTWRLVIEAKIDAEEGEEQLSQYEYGLEQLPQPAELIRIFLTPDGRKPHSYSAEWYSLSFLDLATVFRRTTGLESRPGYHFLRYYLTGVLRDVCRLPVPIRVDCENPYAAAQYLQSVLGAQSGEHS